MLRKMMILVAHLLVLVLPHDASAEEFRKSDLAAVCEPWVQDFTNSIHQGNKSHPFSARLLSQIRENTGVTDGQLELISGLARRLGDPDWEYPLILREGELPSFQEMHEDFDSADTLQVAANQRRPGGVACGGWFPGTALATTSEKTYVGEETAALNQAHIALYQTHIGEEMAPMVTLW
ncbi:unnamed protein product [Cladocopium goreaui]|uniref:Splicing factor 45 n=1 Tax=Cladocopium goreaui TaxID=2562237 RepID=A0A9P1CEA1_9DINO|nr:unnamed protein product [Cladocopium goreaui]